VFASRSHARAQAEGLPRQDHVWITTEQLIRFHINEPDEMLCKLDSAKYARAFQPNPTLPWEFGAQSELKIIEIELN